MYELITMEEVFTREIIEDYAERHQVCPFELALDVMNEDTRVCFLKLCNVCVEAYENGQAVGHPGAIHHIALDVDDVYAAWEAVTAAGFVPMEKEPRFLPFWENGVKFFNITGPNMEIVEFSQYL